jgi:hypothetical protein
VEFEFASRKLVSRFASGEERIHGYNSVNLRHGYPLLEIRTPQEVIGYED